MVCILLLELISKIKSAEYKAWAKIRCSDIKTQNFTKYTEVSLETSTLLLKIEKFPKKFFDFHIKINKLLQRNIKISKFNIFS